MPLKETKAYRYGRQTRRTAQTYIYECSDCSGCLVIRLHLWGGEPQHTVYPGPGGLETNDERTHEPGEGPNISGSGNVIKSVFGLLKHNYGMRRLLMRGKPMVDVEVGLKSLAHNFRKMKTDILGGLTRHLLIAMSLQPADQTI